MALRLLQPISPSFSGRAQSSGYSFSIPDFPRYESPQLSIQQSIRLQQALKRDDEGSSFWDKVKKGGGSVLGKTLNVILRPAWAVAEGSRRALEGEGFDIGDFFKGASRGIQAKRQTLFSEVLEQEGILEGHGRLRGLAGFGLDVVTDPLNLALVAATPFTGGASLGALGAKMSAQQLARKSAVKAIQEGTKLSRGELRTLKFNLASRAEFQPVRAYVDELDKFAIYAERGLTPTTADYARLSIASRAAAETYKQAVPRVLQAQLRIPFSRGKYVPLTPTGVAGMRIAPKAPSLGRIAERGGVLGKVPGMAAGASAVGKAFKLGFNDQLAGAKLTAKHVEESLAKSYSDGINQQLKPFVGMDTEKQFDALAWYDAPEALKGGIVNEARLAKSGLDKQQKEFVRMWHSAMEGFRRADVDFGVEYSRLLEKGRGYVPHLYPQGGSRVLTRSKTGTAGYTKGRKNQQAGIKEIAEKARKEGHQVNDAVDLIQIHARQAAKAHAEKAYRDAVMRGFGVPWKVANKERVAKHSKRLGNQQRTVQSLIRRVDPKTIAHERQTGRSRIGRQFAAKRQAAIRQSQQRKHEIDEKIKDILAEKQAFDEIPRPPIFTKLIRMSEADLRQQVQLGKINKEMAKVIRQVRRKSKQGMSKKELKKFWDLYLERQLYPKRAPFEARLAVQRRTRDRLDDKLAQRLAKIEDEKDAAFQKLDEQIGRELQKNNKALDVVTERLDATERRYMKALVAEVNPTAVKRGWVPVRRQGLRGSLNEPYAFEPRIAEAIQRVERVLIDDAALTKFEEIWMKWLAIWKSTVTVINPGYRSRNTLSDLWNMYIDGVPAWAIPTYGMRAGRIMVHAKQATAKAQKGQRLNKKELEAVRIMDDAYHDGILSGLFTGDIETVAEIGRFGSPYRFLFKKKGAKALPAAGLRVAHAFNRNAENWGRMTHYLYRRQYERMGRIEAAQHVRAAHFDYEELTRFEQRVMKNIAPFYTWTRKNIPFQIQQIASRPGRVATFPKLVQESEAAAGGGEGDIVPEHVRENFGFKVPFGGDQTYLMPQIGFADLAKIEDPRDFANLMNPVGKITAEILTGRSLFSGAPIEGTHPRNPVADPLGITSNILSKIPGTNVGPTQRRIRGQDVGGLGIAPWWAYVFGQLPATNEIFLRRSDIKKAQGGLGGNASLASYLGGLSMSELDEETSTMIEQMEFEEEIQRLIRGLRDENIIPEPEDDGFSDFEQQIQNLIQSSSRR